MSCFCVAAGSRSRRCRCCEIQGGGIFEDVTHSSGLGVPIAGESAAWGDFNNDGKIDVFVCGEYKSGSDSSGSSQPGDPPDPRNKCRLYRNQGDGKFVDVASVAGVTNDRFAKGAVWGDYDDDGLLDLFVSNMNESSRLYHNEGNERSRMSPSRRDSLLPKTPIRFRAFLACSGTLTMTGGWICS